MRILVVFLLIFPNFIFSQEVNVFQSLEEAMKNPEKVINLDLSRERLKEFPMELLNFPNLENLDLSNNRISLIPAEIGDLKNLQVLDLSRNRFNILPPQIGKLKELTS